MVVPGVVLTAVDWIILIFKFGSITDAPTVGCTHWADPLAFLALTYFICHWWDMRQENILRDGYSAWMLVACGVGIATTCFGGCVLGVVVTLSLIVAMIIVFVAGAVSTIICVGIPAAILRKIREIRIQDNQERNAKLIPRGPH